MNPQDYNQQPQQPGGQPYDPAAVGYAQNQVPQAPQQYQDPNMMMQPQQPGVIQPGQPVPGERIPKSNPNSTQNTLLIAEIRDGIVIMNDGSFRAVVLAKSINFDLMSPEEREAVEYAYQGFLNSLYFDIQIFIRSQKVDIRPYIEHLDKLRAQNENMLLALMMEDYINFISILAQETNIMDKQFYMVIPFYLTIESQKTVDTSKKLLGGLFSRGGNNQRVVTVNEADLEKAKTELKNRVQAVMAGLQQVGVQSVPLDTEELIELYYDSYNPDTATRQHIQDFSQLTAPVVSKGVGEAPQPHLDRETM